MDNYDKDDISEQRLIIRLTNRRNGISNKKKIEPQKSTTYCNRCHIPETLKECSLCKNYLCGDCFNGKPICIICTKIEKNQKKIHPTNEMRNGEYVNNGNLTKYIFCCLNSNK